jgi:hypothetical protein
MGFQVVGALEQIVIVSLCQDYDEVFLAKPKHNMDIVLTFVFPPEDIRV